MNPWLSDTLTPYENQRKPLAIIPMTHELRRNLIHRERPYLFHYKNEFGLDRTGILVHLPDKPDNWVAFENRCPHLSTPFMDSKGNVAFDADRSKITCILHGAQFSLTDGYATTELCAGQMVTLFDVKEEGNEILIYKSSLKWNPII